MPAARRKPEPQLFHPKKKPQQARSPPKTGSPRPAPKPEPEDDDVKLPEGPYQEYKIMSSASTGWKYNVMKFNSREPVDVMTWQQPVKLNRKDPRRQEAVASGSQEAAGPMLGPDGKPVIGADGRIVMVDAEGRPIHNAEGKEKGKDEKEKSASNGKKKFQKKTRQVFIVPEAIRQLRREEKFPWVIEDGAGGEVWVGQMEEVSKAETHGFFMPTADNKFQFVSAHRWYKFQKKQKHTQLSAEEVDKLVYHFTGQCMNKPYNYSSRWNNKKRTEIPSSGLRDVAMDNPLQQAPLPSSELKLKVVFLLVVKDRWSCMLGKAWVPVEED